MVDQLSGSSEATADEKDILKTGQTAEVRIITDASPEALGGILNINGKIVAAFFSTVDEEAGRRAARGVQVLRLPVSAGDIGHLGQPKAMEREVEGPGHHHHGPERQRDGPGFTRKSCRQVEAAQASTS